VGEEVLEGLKGVELFDSDVRGYQELHNVWYDPAVTSVEEIESALKEASTHLATER
jgi:hypothetical protein